MRARLSSLGFWPQAGIAVTASLLMALGAPPEGMTALIWLGFVPLVWVARVGRSRRPRSIFALGWFGGLCTGLVGFPWIAETLERFAGAPTPVAWLGLAAFSAWTAIPFGLWTWAVSRGPSRGWRAVGWPLLSWAAISTAWPSLFPYTVVIGFAEVPAWMQLAELGGVPLVAAQVVLVGVLVADATLGGTPRARALRLAVAVAIPVASAGLGTLRLRQIDAEQAGAARVRFGVVQPNTPLGLVDTQERMRRLRGMSQEARDAGAQILVWPEAGAFPFRTRRPFVRDFADPFRSVLRGHGLPTIFGAGSFGPDAPWEYNTLYSMAADGTVTGRFDKVILVPLGEYVPVVDPQWAIEQIPSMSHNLAGSGPARFVVEPAATAERPVTSAVAVGPLICYEDIFPGFAHTVATQPGGIDVFVNATIDTWFGATGEPWEHLALAQFRSVEHRVPMVRSVAAGVSTIVDAGGRIAAYRPARGPTLERAVPPEFLVHDVPLARNTARDPTLFSRGGWRLPWLCQLGALIVVLAALGRTLYSRARAADLEPSPEDSVTGAPSADGRRTS